MDGKGLLKTIDNALIYDGEWKEGTMNGLGTLKLKNYNNISLRAKFKNLSLNLESGFIYGDLTLKTSEDEKKLRLVNETSFLDFFNKYKEYFQN